MMQNCDCVKQPRTKDFVLLAIQLVDQCELDLRLRNDIFWQYVVFNTLKRYCEPVLARGALWSDANLPATNRRSFAFRARSKPISLKRASTCKELNTVFWTKYPGSLIVMYFHSAVPCSLQ